MRRWKHDYNYISHHFWGVTVWILVWVYGFTAENLGSNVICRTVAPTAHLSTKSVSTGLQSHCVLNHITVDLPVVWHKHFRWEFSITCCNSGVFQSSAKLSMSKSQSFVEGENWLNLYFHWTVPLCSKKRKKYPVNVNAVFH